MASSFQQQSTTRGSGVHEWQSQVHGMRVQKEGARHHMPLLKAFADMTTAIQDVEPSPCMGQVVMSPATAKDQQVAGDRPPLWGALSRHSEEDFERLEEQRDCVLDTMLPDEGLADVASEIQHAEPSPCMRQVKMTSAAAKDQQVAGERIPPQGALSRHSEEDFERLEEQRD
eukprot:CAMPEP_0179044948 /NCGR_PEP_ID=MMETSP0796-20121207/17929_1 /TAXON_ID=73915 /ORGANISM="Pyrodinium bahamense, Strain pbaha01" /LENGTH=171 /DNA_ID=CAMNT_0020741347 /DNA_START=92 /DNA_END=604 /DNA_ORIENTATION=+